MLTLLLVTRSFTNSSYFIWPVASSIMVADIMLDIFWHNNLSDDVYQISPSYDIGLVLSLDTDDLFQLANVVLMPTLHTG
jgi:hypothetical protein